MNDFCIRLTPLEFILNDRCYPHDRVEGDDLKDAIETLAVILPAFPLAVSTLILTKYLKGARQRFILEFFSITLPVLLITTIFSDYPLVVNLVIFNVCSILILFNRTCRDGKQEIKPLDADGKKGFITNARATINILTAVAILAIDFQVFPGRFGKTSKHGFSLMDVGVGLFVYANGIVAPETRGVRSPLKNTCLNVIPLFVIGGLRFIITKQIDYHVNVLEYGVHWNFFITLAVTKLLSALIMSLVKVNMFVSAVQGITLLAIHQALLTFGLEEYVFSSVNRDNFFNANREGIVSSLGYVALYFLSVSLGFLMQKATILKQLFTTTIVLSIATFILYINFNISRCLANSTYCTWILSLGLLMTFLFYSTERFFNPKVPFIYESINFNGLTYFLVANLLTGFVNLVFDTDKVPTFYSLIILSLYMLTTTSIVAILYFFNIRLKL